MIYFHFFHYTVSARRYYRGEPRFRESMTLTLTEEHITVQSKLAESKQSWELDTDVLEGETCYVLIYGKDMRMATMLPKRAFRDRQQHAAFRELVGARFGKTLPARPAGELDAAEQE